MVCIGVLSILHLFMWEQRSHHPRIPPLGSPWLPHHHPHEEPPPGSSLHQISRPTLSGRGCPNRPMPLNNIGGAIEAGGFSRDRIDFHLLGLKSCSTWCRSLRAPGLSRVLHKRSLRESPAMTAVDATKTPHANGRAMGKRNQAATPAGVGAAEL